MYIFYDSEGKIGVQMGSSPTTLAIMAEKQAALGFSYIVSDEPLDDTYYISEGKAIKKQDKPSSLHIFNYSTKEWELPTDYLTNFKLTSTALVNKIAGDTILIRYPSYKQLNIIREGGEPATIMSAYIDNIRNLSNITNSAISTATSVESIEQLVADFRTDSQ